MYPPLSAGMDGANQFDGKPLVRLQHTQLRGGVRRRTPRNLDVSSPKLTPASSRDAGRGFF